MVRQLLNITYIHTYIILYFDTLASSTSAVFHEGRVEGHVVFHEGRVIHIDLIALEFFPVISSQYIINTNHFANMNYFEQNTISMFDFN